MTTPQRSEPPASVPQVPPGCEMFFTISGDSHGRDGLWFSPHQWEREDVNTWSHDSDFPWRLTSTSADCASPEIAGNYRRIIAAVAEVAWLKEAERIAQQTRCLHIAALSKERKQRDDALECAKQWRKWGAE